MYFQKMQLLGVFRPFLRPNLIFSLFFFFFACRCSNLVVGPDQRQVFYTVTGDNGQSQQYAMMDFRDPNLIHQFTNIRQIPRGNRTIPQPRNGPGAGGGAGGMHIIISTLL